MDEKEKGGVPSGVMTEIRNRTAERDAEIIPVARKLLSRLAAREDLLMGNKGKLTEEQAALYYQKLYQEEVVPLLVENNIKLNAIPYLFSIMMQPISLLNDVTTSSFEMNRDLADAGKWGIKDIDDLRVKDLDEALKALPKSDTAGSVDK